MFEGGMEIAHNNFAFTLEGRPGLILRRAKCRLMDFVYRVVLILSGSES